MKPVEPKFLVWVVALAASAEAFLEGLAAAVQSRTHVVVIWIAGAAVLFAIAMAVERVKRRGVKS